MRIMCNISNKALYRTVNVYIFSTLFGSTGIIPMVTVIDLLSVSNKCFFVSNKSGSLKVECWKNHCLGI